MLMARGSCGRLAARDMAWSICSSVVMTLCMVAMNSLPERGERFEILCRCLQNVSNGRSFCIRGPDRICSFGQSHIAVFAKVNDDFGIPEDAVHMSWQMIVGVCGESDSVATD
jgi:hypothetical protein